MDLPIVCFCVIFHKGRILLLKRSSTDPSHPNTWWFPGGHVEQGETLEQGVIREVYEEADITLQKSDIDLVYTDTSTSGKPLFLFRGNTSSPFVALKDGEHSDFAWVKPSDILHYNRTSTFLSYIKEAIMFHSSQYGLTSLSAVGSSYSEAALAPSSGAVTRKGVVSDKSKVNPYHAPIIYRRNKLASKQGYGASDCGCPKEGSFGGLFTPAQKEAIVYGNPMGFFTGASTTMKVAYVLLAAGVVFGAYTGVKSLQK